MDKKEVINKVIENGAVAVIRMEEPDKLLKVAEALYNGGLKSIEITMTVPDAINVIKKVSDSVTNDMLIGVGSVLDEKIAQQAIDAGAKYVVSPILKREVLEVGFENNVPVFPGAFTPTEIQQAYEWGAEIVKVFPADVLGMKYFKSIKAPMPHLNLMPTGGVTLDNAGQWMANGACAVGIGSALLDKNAIREENYEKLENNAKLLMKNINEFRKS